MPAVAIDFATNTPILLKRALMHAQDENTHIRVFYGCQETGRDSLECNDTIGRFTSEYHWGENHPALLQGGFNGDVVFINTARIVRVMDVSSGEDIYTHEDYHMPRLSVLMTRPRALPYVIEQPGHEVVADFRSEEEARHYVDFLQGLVHRRTNRSKVQS